MKETKAVNVAAPAPTLATAATARSTTRVRSNFALAARRFLRQRLAVVGLAITLVLLVIGVFAPVLAPKSYAFADLAIANQFPNSQHPMGTDTIGHDYLSRIIYGVRT